MKPYIDLNTELRTKATNDFEKNFFKLLCNAIYGKTMENIRSRVDIKLKSSWEGRYGLQKLISDPRFKRCTIFEENLVAVELYKTIIYMNKPISVGMVILDLSKILMYEFHYDYMKTKYGNNIQVMYTGKIKSNHYYNFILIVFHFSMKNIDTDSFIYEIKTDCFYTDMKKDLHRYDTSDYPTDNMFNIPRVNKKVPGLFKDEMKSKIMIEFIGLRSKMYAIKIYKDLNKSKVDVIKKAKGVKKYVVSKHISFDNFFECVHSNCTLFQAKQNSIRSELHKVYSITQNKIVLSPLDNKRYILDNKIDTLPWGHYKLE